MRGKWVSEGASGNYKKIIKIITTLKMGRMHEISSGRQEVTGLGGSFLVGMRTRAVSNPRRERNLSDSQGRRPGVLELCDVGQLAFSVF